jgi:hypothetical protein
LPDIRWHDLRHTCATLLLGRGVHPKMVQHLIGHTSIQLTLDRYSTGYPRWEGMLPRAWTRSWDRVYCCPTAAKSLVFALRVLGFLQDLQEKQRADERTRTAYPCSLRVCGQRLLSVAGVCKSRIYKGYSVPSIAHDCRVLLAG